MNGADWLTLHRPEAYATLHLRLCRYCKESRRSGIRLKYYSRCVAAARPGDNPRPDMTGGNFRARGPTPDIIINSPHMLKGKIGRRGRRGGMNGRWAAFLSFI